jgi:acyl-CoA hydrolase
MSNRGSSHHPQPPADASATGETRLLEVVFPEHSNHYGTLFAGNALSLMAKAAYIAGARRAGRNVVMATAEKVDFLEPVKVGELIEIVARVARAGTSSMTVAVEINRENLASKEHRTAMRGQFEMVAVNEQGRPVRIDPDES